MHVHCAVYGDTNVCSGSEPKAAGCTHRYANMDSSEQLLWRLPVDKLKENNAARSRATVLGSFPLSGAKPAY